MSIVFPIKLFSSDIKNDGNNFSCIKLGMFAVITNMTFVSN